VRAGVFREDLYHRLHVVELRVPPLRDRREEIPPLVEHFRRALNRDHGLPVKGFAPDALDALYRHPWPGNVRELRNVLERAMLLAGGPTVERVHLALPQTEETEAVPPPADAPGLTPRQERILARARKRGETSNRLVVDEEQVSARTALRELQKLVERGLLVRVGRRRGAVYRPRSD
jgi:DNA-binding NtrC family response regulator